MCVLGLGVAVLVACKIHAEAHGYSYSSSSRLAWSMGYLALLVVASYGAGFPDLRQTRRSAWKGAVLSTAVATGGFSAIQLLVGDALLPRFVVFSVALFAVPWLVFCARLASTGSIRAEERDRFVAVAGPSDVGQLEDDLALAGTGAHCHLVGAIGPAEASTAAGGMPVVDLARDQDASLVVLSREAQNDESVVAQAALLHERGVRVRTLSLFYEQWLHKLPVSELERVSLLFDIGELHRSRYGRAKRLIDVVLAGAGLVALALVTPVVLVGDLLANRGPLFYRQERVGKGGRCFRILKFRTMREGGDESWTQDDDPRVTAFGRLLRTSHLDELPQVLNILRGDLTVVGPRPEQPRYVEELNRKLPFYDLRHLVRPGLTGWAQVTYGYAGDERDALQKLQYEFFYLRHQRLAFDLRIIGRTIRSVLGSEGRGR